MANMPGNWNAFPEDIEADAIAHAFETPMCAPGLNGELVSSGSGHTCHWLYKSLVMDATGRVLPCCSAPRPDADLVFGRFDGHGDPFNSQKYRDARMFFSTGAVPSDKAPYCAQCDWDQTEVVIGGPEIRRYFRAVDPVYFDHRSLKLLSGW
jgi:hypothetical protein